MAMSYQEKSILGSLLAFVVVFGSYFVAVLRDLGRPDFEGGTFGRLVFAVIAIVLIEIAYHIVLALESKPEPKDERNVLIECKGYRNAYFLLAGGAFLVIVWVAMGHPAPTRIAVANFVTVNLILLVMVIADLMKFLTQLFYYRRGLR